MGDLISDLLADVDHVDRLSSDVFAAMAHACLVRVAPGELRQLQSDDAAAKHAADVIVKRADLTQL